MQEENKETLLSWLWRMVKGMIIGTGAILPGISGGVLAVVLGIYRPVMEFLSNPFKSFKKQYKFFIPIVIGFGIGVILLSKLVDWLFRENEVPAVWLFIGLVLGTVPSLYKEAGEHGRNTWSFVAFGISAIIMFVFLDFISGTVSAAVSPSTLWWFISGMLIGIGLVVPGMSPSSLLIFLGLYQPMSAGIASLDFGVLIPLGIGMAMLVLVLAKPIKYLFDKHYMLMYHIILGIVIASTAVIMPFGNASGFSDILVYVICFIVGVVIAYFMEKTSNKLDKNV